MDDPMAREEARGMEGKGKKDGGNVPAATGAKSLFAKPSLDDVGPGTDLERPVGNGLFRKNTLDEMTVGRTEKPIGAPERDDPRPIVRGKVGAGSYEDPSDQKRKGRTKGKTGKPGK